MCRASAARSFSPLSFSLVSALFIITFATDVSQIAGEYELISGKGSSESCPKLIRQPAPTELDNSPSATLAHKDMTADGATCASDSGDSARLAVISAAEFQRRTKTPVDTSEPLNEAVIRLDALMGTESTQDRKCGDFTLRKGAFVAFVNSREDPNFVDKFSELEEGRTVMLLAEAGGVSNPVRCVYASKSVQEEVAKSSGCFPSAAKFHTPSHPNSRLRAGELSHGTELVSGRILAFTHRDISNTMYPYVRIHADSAQLTVSPSHYVILASGRLRAASAVVPGDALLATPAGSKPHVVRFLERVEAPGRVNPHTANGVVHVDGFQVSCYTTAVHPRLAHAAVSLLHSLDQWAHSSVLNVVRQALAAPEKNMPAWFLSMLPAGPEEF